MRQLKVAENQSPQPQDRVYFTFNYFNNVNQLRNQEIGATINDIKVYRYVWGFEKTFLDGQGSIGLRLPLDNLSATSKLPGFGGTSTAVGDMSAIVKYVIAQNPDTGSLISVGGMLTLPTGPHNFAGAKGFGFPNDTTLTPYIGYYLAAGRLYFHGFSSIEIPTDQNDVTLIYNDIGLGYFVYQNPKYDRFLNAIAPTFEVHVNTPLTHTSFNPTSANVFNGTYNVVDLTFGSNFLLGKRGLLAMALVEPITGPRPFNLEAIMQFTLRF